MTVSGLRDATLARSATDHPPPLPRVHPHPWHPTLRASRATGDQIKAPPLYCPRFCALAPPLPRELHFHLIPGLSTGEPACYLPNRPFPTPGVLGNARTELLCIRAPPKALTYSNSPTFHLQSLIRNHFLSPGTILVCHLSCPPNPSFSSLGALVFPHSEDTIRGTHHLHPRTHRPGDWARLAYRRQDAPQGAELAIRGGDGQVFPLPRRVAGAPSPSQMCWLHMVWIKKNRTA